MVDSLTEVITPNVEDLIGKARMLLRDFPQFFEADLGPLNVSTVRLPHPNVDLGSLQVYASAQPGQNAEYGEQVTLTAVSDDNWVLDQRNGLLKFKNNTYLGQRIFISGYFFEWFLDADLAFHIGIVIDEHLQGRFAVADLAKSQVSQVELDVIAIGAVVRAIWTLLTEFSTDIDVSSPEGMFIPARQRFQQLWQMLQHWEGIYSERTKQLNVGLGRIDIFDLRRVGYMTNRLIPVYKEREYDDHEAPVRIRPEISDGTTTPPVAESGSDIEVSDMEEIGRESSDLGFGGWQSIGSRGD